MNIKELNEIVKANQKNILEETIEEIENNIVCRAKKGFNDIDIVTNRRYYNVCYTIDKWMFEPIKEHFEDNGYNVEIEEMKTPIKWIDKMLGIYEPDYLVIISWEEV